MKKFWVIADIHGEFDKVVTLMRIIKDAGFDLDAEQEFVQLGDKNDRGPKTYEVFEYFKGLQEAYPTKVHLLIGNHEVFMMEAAAHDGFGADVWFLKNNGGSTTLRSYEDHTKIYGKHGFGNALQHSGHWEFMRNHLLFLETEDYFFSHAPIPKPLYRNLPDGRDFRTDRDTLIWSYNSNVPEADWVDTKLVPIEEDGNFYGRHKYTVHGHLHGMHYRRVPKAGKDATFKGAYTEELVIPGARKYGSAIFLDSGCGCADSAPLSALELPEMNVYTSDGKKFNLIGEKDAKATDTSGTAI